MSTISRIIISAMRGIKKTGFIKGPGEDLDADLRSAKAYNRKHPYKQPTDRKAVYQTINEGNYPCLVIRQHHNQASEKAILFLHGGGDRDTWKPEVSFARNYGKQSGMDVFYPLYPPFSETSPVRTADYIFELYCRIAREYGADRTAVIGGSYGGFLAMQLLTWINHNNEDKQNERIDMPKVLIMNSPFAYPKSEKEWQLAERMEREDAMIPTGAFRFMLGLTLKTAPDTPDHALYPEDMDFRKAPETYIFYAEEACSAVAGAIKRSYERAGASEQLHMHIEPGMMHCYASAPVFKESRRDFKKQIELLQQI